jgi:hypothetical protein
LLDANRFCTLDRAFLDAWLTDRGLVDELFVPVYNLIRRTALSTVDVDAF